MSKENPWKTLSTQIIYENPWFSVREDQVIKPNGSPGIYGVVSTRAATGAVAITEKNEIYLVGQYRYPTEVYSWEIPEGGADPGESPLEAIKRELREEAGIEAESWERLGPELHLSNCFSAERGYLYLARDLKEVPRAPDETEVLEVIKIPLKEAIAMIEKGEIFDTMTLVALYRAEKILGL